MIKKTSDSHFNIFIENIQIKHQVYECETFGVTVNQHLTWKSNTDGIWKKICAGISAIRRVARNVRQSHYYSFIPKRFLNRLWIN